jgi:Fur family transcriptional regulator, ferric uptake regulator
MEKEILKMILGGKQLKLTKGRDEILREIDEIKGHFDQQTIYKRLKAKGSRIGRASVYRTLPILVETVL